MQLLLHSQIEGDHGETFFSKLQEKLWEEDAEKGQNKKR